jgi:hypothetical protein
MHDALREAAQLGHQAAGYASESNDPSERDWWLRMLQAALRFGWAEQAHH